MRLSPAQRHRWHDDPRALLLVVGPSPGGDAFLMRYIVTPYTSQNRELWSQVLEMTPTPRELCRCARKVDANYLAALLNAKEPNGGEAGDARALLPEARANG